MKYNFDELTERRGTGALKWEVGENELPMWVADMDFRTAPEIVEAICAKAAQGIYGYTVLPAEWGRAVAGWWESRHHFRVEESWLLFCAGVVPAISSVVRKLTTPGENVVVQTPVYNMFFRCIEDNGRHAAENRLLCDGKGYCMDFEDLEQKLSDSRTGLMILCNPQNPAGKIWDRETLARVGELCAKYHVPVLSDEIHCDLTAPGREYVPFASVSDACRENSITCISPTKTFNLAGVQTSAVIVPDEKMRCRVQAALETDGVGEPNFFAAQAAVAAFTHGGEWLDELRKYLWENRRLAEDYIARKIPEIRTIPSDATYLMWLDCTAVLELLERESDRRANDHGANNCDANDRNAYNVKALGNTNDKYGKIGLCNYIRNISGLFLNDGDVYRGERGFLRMNLACPASRVREGLERLKKSVESLRQ